MHQGLPWSKAKLVSTQLVACGPPNLLDLLLFDLWFRLHVVYLYMQKMDNIKMFNAYGEKCNMMHE
jgi:hypothetical protein